MPRRDALLLLVGATIASCARPPDAEAAGAPLLEVRLAAPARAAASSALRVRRVADFSAERLATLGRICGYDLARDLPEPQRGTFGATAWTLSGPDIAEVSLFDLGTFDGASDVSERRIVAVQAPHGARAIAEAIVRSTEKDVVRAIGRALKASGYCDCPGEIGWDSPSYRRVDVTSPDSPGESAGIAFVTVVELGQTAGVAVHVEDQRVLVVDRTARVPGPPDCLSAIAPATPP